MNIGYVGLGNMGGALAARLQLSFPLHVFDLNGEAVRRMTEAGATSSTSLGELASHCDVILLCLPTSEHVKRVIFGESGLGAKLNKGTLIIDQTSGDPRITRQIASELSDLSVEFVDAPVSGGREGAMAGTIAIMVGAKNDQYQRAASVLSAISPNLFHAGEIGAGHAMKLVNNMLSGAQRVLSLEALALAVKNGIEPQKAAEILVAGGARNAFLQSFHKQGIQRAEFTLALMHKDMRLACDLGSESRVALPLSSSAREIYQMAINQFGTEASVLAVALLIDQFSKTQLVPSELDLL